MDIEFNAREVEALRVDLLRSSDAAQANIEKAAERISEAVAATARRRVPRDRGNAQASLRVIGGALTAGGSKAPYFGWLDFGGRTGIKKSVSRPYRRGGRYIYPALVSEDSTITKILTTALDDTLRAGDLDG